MYGTGIPSVFIAGHGEKNASKAGFAFNKLRCIALLAAPGPIRSIIKINYATRSKYEQAQLFTSMMNACKLKKGPAGLGSIPTFDSSMQDAFYSLGLTVDSEDKIESMKYNVRHYIAWNDETFETPELFISKYKSHPAMKCII